MVQEKNVASLIDAMEKIINCGPLVRQRMGKNGRRMAIQRFDEKIIVKEYINLLNQIDN